ncbi:hypothetical protein ZHAS_00011038 [Anopheles sinensis]|uniref:Uncharacterized protein n=1 Tax=Anopheles sinensis TaxID=74873 RepID=A0A084VZ63_ANOSI|nr:hypothetical protein ZHAS_00011038 [Anopheles sinensis]
MFPAPRNGCWVTACPTLHPSLVAVSKPSAFISACLLRKPTGANITWLSRAYDLRIKYSDIISARMVERRKFHRVSESSMNGEGGVELGMLIVGRKSAEMGGEKPEHQHFPARRQRRDVCLAASPPPYSASGRSDSFRLGGGMIR